MTGKGGKPRRSRRGREAPRGSEPLPARAARAAPERPAARPAKGDPSAGSKSTATAGAQAGSGSAGTNDTGGANDPVTLLSRRRWGVFWAGPRPDTEALGRAAAAAGWDFAPVDGASVTDKGALLDALARALSFPDGFGRNWDALEDFLGDLSWREGQGTLLVWSPVDPLARQNPGALSTALDVLRSACEGWRLEGRPFLAILGGDERPRSLDGRRRG